VLKILFEDWVGYFKGMDYFFAFSVRLGDK
jgi:hypothetical protein